MGGLGGVQKLLRADVKVALEGGEDAFDQPRQKRCALVGAQLGAGPQRGQIASLDDGAHQAVVELGGGGQQARPYGVYRPAVVPADLVPQHVVVLGGARTVVESIAPPGDVHVEPTPGPSASVPEGATVRSPLGTIIGSRSGDKGGNANLGVFARTDEAWAWLDSFLTADRLRALLPEAASLPIDRHRLASIRSLNFVIHGLLEEGVAASTRKDPQAKSLGEWLRARVVDIPAALLEGR